MRVVDAVRKTSDRLLRGLAEQLRIRLMLFGMRFFPQADVHGVRLVHLLRTDDHTNTFFTKVAEALAFICVHDEKQYRKVVRLLKRIVLVPAGGEYVDTPLSAYVMDVPTLLQRAAPGLALKIIHEATHLRLIRAGIPYSDALQDRIEAICIRQEIAFAERTPSEFELVEEARRKLGERWWHDEAREERHARYLDGYPLSNRVRTAVRRLFRLDT